MQNSLNICLYIVNQSLIFGVKVEILPKEKDTRDSGGGSLFYSIYSM